METILIYDFVTHVNVIIYFKHIACNYNKIVG